MRVSHIITIAVMSVWMSGAAAQVRPGTASEHSFSQFLYSKSVGDSFLIFTHLPDNYHPDSGRRYPVVFLLDANFGFDIAAATIDKYAYFGLTEEAILIGVGYRNAMEMDSLRDRDYTYPAAPAESKMPQSGGANRFLAFFNDELIPRTDRLYKTDTSARILYGHSMGGYFVTYALVKNTQRGTRLFSHYIAASPELNYNKYHLLKELEQISADKKTSIYFSFGGLEDAEDADVPGKMKVSALKLRLSAILKPTGLRYKADLFSDLAHMDTPMPSFIKGLQWSLSNYDAQASGTR